MRGNAKTQSEKANNTAEFKEVNNTKVFISKANKEHLNCEEITLEDRDKDMELLKQNGLRMPTYREALVLIDRNQELKVRLKGKWFYFGGKNLEKDEGRRCAFDDDGTLRQTKYEDRDVEKTVETYTDIDVFTLLVQSNDDAQESGSRFFIDVNEFGNDILKVVVGVPVDYKMAATKIEVAGAADGITITGITTEQLEALLRDSTDEIVKLTETIGKDNLPKTRKLIEVLRVKE